MLKFSLIDSSVSKLNKKNSKLLSTIKSSLSPINSNEVKQSSLRLQWLRANRLT